MRASPTPALQTKNAASSRVFRCTVRRVPDDPFSYAFAGRPYIRRMFWKLR